MITAKNYAAQAERSLRLWADKSIEQFGFYDDAAKLYSLADTVKNSVHFAIEDNGLIFDDDRKGIKGYEIRLPFPRITIEYCTPVHNKPKVPNKWEVVEAKKRIIIAEEVPISEFNEILTLNNINKELFKNSDYVIMLYALFANDDIFVPCQVISCFPSKWDSYSVTSPMTVKINFECTLDSQEAMIVQMPIPFCKQFTEKMAIQNGLSELELYEASISDISFEIRAFLEFIEALSCKNVEFATIQSALPKAEAVKRAKKGKLPIYETKVLSLKVNEIKSTVKSTGLRAGHASPRQHLRRGHIRRLESGNIWVNSCIVGDASKGVVHKSYDVVK